jgi:hypothetical protein
VIISFTERKDLFHGIRGEIILILCFKWSTSGITVGYGLDNLGFESRQGLGIFPFITASRQPLGHTQLPMQWGPGSLSFGAKRPGRESDHSPPSSAEVKNVWSYTSTPQICFHILLFYLIIFDKWTRLVKLLSKNWMIRVWFSAVQKLSLFLIISPPVLEFTCIYLPWNLNQETCDPIVSEFLEVRLRPVFHRMCTSQGVWAPWSPLSLLWHISQ